MPLPPEAPAKDTGALVAVSLWRLYNTLFSSLGCRRELCYLSATHTLSSKTTGQWPEKGLLMRAIYSVAFVALAALIGAAYAEEPAKSTGIYVGAEVGTAKSQSTVPATIGATTVNESATGWTAFVGIRPQKFVGLEFSYIDFGNAHKDYPPPPGPPVDALYRASASNSAYAGYVMGYLPLPEHWDLFGKVGYASVNTKTESNGNYPNSCTGQPCIPIGMASFSTNYHNGEFAWGLGTQYRFNSLGVRAEYQRLSGSYNHQDLISVGLTWQF
jgi:Outer membrane protein beta-barrel domain